MNELDALDKQDAIPQANDKDPQWEFQKVEKLEHWLVQTIEPIQQLFHIGADLKDFAKVGAGNIQNLPEFEGDLLQGIDKAEQLLHWRSLWEQGKDLNKASCIALTQSHQALSFVQLQALLTNMLARVYCAHRTQASVHRFALSSVIYPLLKEWNQELIIQLFIQWLILNGVFPKEKPEEWKDNIAFELNAILESMK